MLVLPGKGGREAYFSKEATREGGGREEEEKESAADFLCFPKRFLSPSLPLLTPTPFVEDTP